MANGLRQLTINEVMMVSGGSDPSAKGKPPVKDARVEDDGRRPVFEWGTFETHCCEIKGFDVDIFTFRPMEIQLPPGPDFRPHFTSEGQASAYYNGSYPWLPAD
jgi:hypothetical protein